MPRARAFLEIGTSLFLLWTVLLPFQNYEQMNRLVTGGILIWLLAFLVTRSRSLISPGVLFHFSLLISFYLSATMENGYLYEWFLWIALFQWAGVLWFTAMRPEDSASSSLFLIACLISPLASSILDPGFWLWTLLVLRVNWVMYSESERTHSIPWYLIAFLLICLFSIPFSFHSWRNVQFLMVNCACIAAYNLSSNRQDRAPLLTGYLAGAITLIAFAYSREIAALQVVGTSVLRMRLSMVQFHNDLAPTFIILSAMLLYFWNNLQSPRRRIVLTFCLPLLAVLEFLTYSRTGWLAYLVFATVYILLRGKKAFLLPAAAAVCALLSLGVVRGEFEERLTNSNSIRERTFNWKVGLATVAEHPVAGVGWLNFYTHAKLPKGISTFTNLDENQKLIPIQTHSMLLDLAEAGGVLLAGLFVFIIARHLFSKRDAALTAGIAGIAVICVGDSACLWLPAYPHLWILLGLTANLGGRVSTPAVSRHATRRMKYFFLASMFMFALLMVLKDRSLRLGSFYHRTNQDNRALTQIRIAGFIALSDVAPLEQLKEIYLTRQDGAGAKQIVQKMISMKKDYAPYYTELGRIEMIQGNFQESARHFETAIRLDPYSGLDGNPYLYLTQIAQRLSNHQNFETYRNRSFLLRLKAGSIEPAKSFWNNENLQQVLEDTDLDIHSTEDWITAMENIYGNCMALGRSDLAEQVFEHAIRRKRSLPAWAVDDFSIGLADLYAANGKAEKIRALIGLCTEPVAPALKARMELASGNLEEAHQDLRKSMNSYNYDEIQDMWAAYYSQAKMVPELRKHFEVLEKLPIPFASSWRALIAKSYVQKEQYESAAAQFHRLSQYHYEDTRPHWQETRSWWLAGKTKNAESANDRLQRLVASNWFTANLYRSDMKAFLWDGSGILNIALPNRAGGWNWRTALYVHPLFEAAFPNDRMFSEVHGEVALMGEVWDKDTDGVIFQISNHDGKKLSSMRVDPKNNPSQRRWNRFDWKSSHGPEGITLMTLPGGHPSYDWAVWAFDP